MVLTLQTSPDGTFREFTAGGFSLSIHAVDAFVEWADMAFMMKRRIEIAFNQHSSGGFSRVIGKTIQMAVGGVFRTSLMGH